MDFFGMDLATFIMTAGYAGVFLVIFIQTAFLFGIVLPGSSFLLTAGLLASLGYFHIAGLVIAAFIGSVAGDSVGYMLGRKSKSAFFKENQAGSFRHTYMKRAEKFYKKHGGKTVIFARFIHFARSVVPTLAGVSKMSYGQFLTYSVIGSTIWTIGVPILGYRFGVSFPEHLLRYITFGLVGVLIGSLIVNVVRTFFSNRPKNTSETLCLRLKELGQHDLNIAGGKAANIGELMRIRMPVPEGFITTTKAYDLFVEHNNLQPVIDTVAARDDEPGKRIREMFMGGDIPPTLKKQILKYYAALPCKQVAVRSSATAEDLPEAAFAGQQDTFLNISDENDLLEAVKKSLASLWTERAIRYREKQKIDTNQLKLAVIVQCMATAEFAGVMFTANPVTGNRDETAIDANPGLGEAVVSGRVTPDHYVLKKRLFGWNIKTSKIGKREVVITPHKDGGVREISKQEHKTLEELPKKAVLKLAQMGHSIERHFGAPQDIEWAWDGTQIHILQTRPVTALPKQTGVKEKIIRQGVGILAEVFAIRPYPLDATLWWKQLGNLLNRMVRPLGLRIRPFHRMFTQKNNVFVSFRNTFPIRPKITIFLSPIWLLCLSIRYNPVDWKKDALVDKIRSEAKQLESIDVQTLPNQALLDLADEAAESILTAVATLRYRYLPPAGIALGGVRVWLSLIGEKEAFGKLISGLETETSKSNDALHELVTLARSTTKIKTLLTQHAAEDILESLKNEKKYADFLSRFHAFLERYGHRETHFTGPSQPTWKHAPEVVIGFIKASISSNKKMHANNKPSSTEQVKKRVLQHWIFKFSIPKTLFLFLLKRGRYFLQVREDTHYFATYPLPIMRNAFMEYGERLVDVGVLETAEEVFHITFDELKKLAVAWPPENEYVQSLRSTVKQRKQLRKDLRGTPLISQQLSRSQAPTSDVLLKGIPGSPGVVEGRVKIINTPEEFHKMRNGDILVAPHTNPAWTPLFSMATAVVVNTGGVGSHAAIVAREYDIPAVMATRAGTTKLTDGQTIMVDGHRGIVAKLKDTTDQ